MSKPEARWCNSCGLQFEPYEGSYGNQCPYCMRGVGETTPPWEKGRCAMQGQEPERQDWVRIHERGTFFCQRCGEAYTVNLPVSMGMFSAMASQFLEEHQRCKQEHQGRKPEQEATP